MVLRLALGALLAALPPAAWAFDGSAAQANGLAAQAAQTGRRAADSPAALKAARPDRPDCPADWEQKRRGDCWVPRGIFGGPAAPAYVHPKGWVVDPRCFEDPRFSGREFLAALDRAWKKLDPGTPASAGGCLGTFNPAWGRRLVDSVWTRHVHVSCPSYDKTETTCAHHEPRDHYYQDERGFSRRIDGYYSLLVLRNVEGCTKAFDSSGLAGVLFHETLHAAGADNFPTEKHNTAWKLEQYVFVRDRVYGAEATCFFGVDPAKRPYVNVLQCRGTVSYDNPSPNHELCREFDASFTNLMPPGFLKH
ncbi:MAG: hypothetical protein HY553_14075 [Elusimicrobia bacterium]|nr:hypothetical protein [Elusimicrobiota bacterium]